MSQEATFFGQPYLCSLQPNGEVWAFTKEVDEILKELYEELNIDKIVNAVHEHKITRVVAPHDNNLKIFYIPKYPHQKLPEKWV